LEDLAAERIPEPADDTSPDTIAALVSERVPDFVSFGGWQAIDRAEVERGEPLGRPRVKFATVEEMLDAARDGGDPH
jgi:ferredoxin--NADP+ reductase